MKRLPFLQYIFAATTTAVLLASAPEAGAFDASVYADNSRLANGRWLKISVDADGLYLITPSTLRSWGFSDLSKIRIYGYGGRRQADALTINNYRDDLPEVQTVTTDAGIIFYGVGAGEWVKSNDTYRYKQNDFSNYGYYFVSETDTAVARAIEKISATTSNTTGYTNTFIERTHHELEQTSVPGEAGPLLLGEEFRYTRSRTITMPTPGAVDGKSSFAYSFVSNISGGGRLSFIANDTTITDRISIKSSSSYVHGVENTSTHTLKSASRKESIDIVISLTATGTCSGAWLNYLSLNYPRSLSIPSEGYLSFYPTAGNFTIGGVQSGVRLLDVTDPHNIVEVEGSLNNGTLGVSYKNGRDFVIWNPSAKLPTPKVVGYVSNQNLHSLSDMDMVIVAPSAFSAQATRLANLHIDSPDSLKVCVVTPEQIYNEYSSGTPDVGGIRRFFKMLYDRGKSGNGRTLRYAVLMGRTTLDNRGLSSLAPSYPTIPSWMPSDNRASLSDNEGYCTDDVTAMLEDGSGTSLGTDKLSIAIGRIPVVSVEEAKNVVDKAIQYAEGARKTAWKHRFMFLADDQDASIHLKQSENMVNYCTATDRQQHLIRKVYMDAYPVEGTMIPEARAAMFRYLNEGVVWWNFIGHANTTGWTHENQLSYSDLNSMYLRHWPFIYAATCNFLRIDGNSISGGEILYKERYGGAIGIISAVRPVYISNNGDLSSAIGRVLATRDAAGRLLTPGEIYRLGKNNILTSAGTPANDTNRLRYSFIGDPALRLATPSNIVHLDSINGLDVDNNDNQIIMAALSRMPISGSITDPDGNILENFNGVASIEIFDAEQSITTLGHGDGGKQETFEDYGERIYCGSAKVVNGRFNLTVTMPAELSQNFRPAAMSLYAYSTEDDTEAIGLNRNFYVYGYDEDIATDDQAPVIESFVLNHSSFKNGDAVNTSPMIIASVRDDIGINVSSAGIGHQMTATLDGRQTYTDISFYYTPSSDGSPSGVINYPLDDLRPGNHTLALRIWDTAGNSATSELDFFVQENLAPKIYDVYTDANPASTQANFYLSHDQPDNMVTVTVSVYNLLGQPLWSGSASGRSDMFTSMPVTWDLSDGSGRRVPRGIYLYRATITTDGETYETASRKIAVTAR